MPLIHFSNLFVGAFAQNASVVWMSAFTNRYQGVPSTRWKVKSRANVVESKYLYRLGCFLCAKFLDTATLSYPCWCLVELSRLEKSILLQEINTPIHQFSIYLSEKRDLTYSCSCQSWDKLLFRLKVFGWATFDVLRVWSLTIRRQFCIFCSGGGIADYLLLVLSCGERSKLSIRIHVRLFMMLDSWSYICSWCMLALSCFQQSHAPLDSILPSAGGMTRRTGSGQGNLTQR